MVHQASRLHTLHSAIDLEHRAKFGKFYKGIGLVVLFIILLLSHIILPTACWLSPFVPLGSTWQWLRWRWRLRRWKRKTLSLLPVTSEGMMWVGHPMSLSSPQWHALLQLAGYDLPPVPHFSLVCFGQYTNCTTVFLKVLLTDENICFTWLSFGMNSICLLRCIWFSL
jgi:hypothetical protein